MDNENVFGNRISVNFRTKTDNECAFSPPKDYNKSSSTSESSLTSSSSSSSSRDSSLSPRPSTHEDVSSQKRFSFPPPPVITDLNSPSLLKQINSMPKSTSDTMHAYSTAIPNGKREPSRERKGGFTMEWRNIQTLCHTSDKFQDISAFSPFKKDQEHNKKFVQRNVGRVSPFVMQECDISSANPLIPLAESSLSRRHNASNAFPLFSSHGFHALSQISVPIREIQRISDPISYAAQWAVPIPIESTHSISRTMSSEGLTPIELHVSNLDPSFEINEMKKTLLAVFSEHVMVIHISMSLQPDGSAKAVVRVPSFQDAQYAISRLHRRKIGHKRILISHGSCEKSPPFHVLKSETIALLNDIPTKNLPLIKFRELYEKRYHRPIAVSDLHRMRDAVTLQEESGSRTVYLNLDCYKTPSLPDSEDPLDLNMIERPYCERHFRVSDSQGWAEQYSVCPLPLVCITLNVLSTAVHRLLDSHQGSLPLISFCDCYESEIGPLPVVGSVESPIKEEEETDATPSENNPAAKKGVPLEHLIACVTGVEVAKSILCIKKIQWLENRIIEHHISQTGNPALMGALTLFGREVIDLLKSQPQCLVAFNKFIPTYHHHFGRQCRVADYGFTKLIDLLEAIPHIVQVLGEGQNRQVTLTHRTQVKRFSAELLRILKSRASKQITISEFALAYEQVIEKPFEITSYGVCDIHDMLEQVPENAIVICNQGQETVIEIPKREQTSEEIERTKQFSLEVIELMKHTPHCSMAFNKFIPSYHHHYGKQCRVADYGFTKLIELFEAIPNILEVTGSGEDKILNLVQEEQHKILSERLVRVLKEQRNEVMDINLIGSAYALLHGHALRAKDFGFCDIHELIEKLDSTLRVVFGYGKTYVTLVDQKAVHQISLNLRRLLMEQVLGKMSVSGICKAYLSRFGQPINLSLLQRDIQDSIEVKGDVVSLKPVQLLVRNMILLLQDYDGHILYSAFGALYHQKFGEPLCASAFDFPSLYAFLQGFPDYFFVVGKKQKRTIWLNNETVDARLPDFSHIILNDPIPSCVPSPALKPEAEEEDSDNLMGFETPMIEAHIESPNFENAETLHCFPRFSVHVPEEPFPVLPHQIKTEPYIPSSTGFACDFNAQSNVSIDTQSTFEVLPLVQKLTVIKSCEDPIEPEYVQFGSRSSSYESYKKTENGDFVRGSPPEETDNLRSSKESHSSKSTPSLSDQRQNKRTRIAAQFSMVVD